MVSMSAANQSDNLLIQRIRAGEADAWTELIARFEGRLLAYVEGRMHQRAAAEDIVQEAFIGFLTSLPNYDARQPLEGYLFSIAAHKLTDHLRREGRRPTLPLAPTSSCTSTGWQPPDRARAASSIVRQSERQHLEEKALVTALGDQIQQWRTRDQWDKLKCLEMLFVRGWANKDVAIQLGLSEQTVANYKFEFIAKMQTAVRKQGLPPEVFPELYEQ